jgi:hypothetical protein
MIDPSKVAQILESDPGPEARGAYFVVFQPRAYPNLVGVWIKAEECMRLLEKIKKMQGVKR